MAKQAQAKVLPSAEVEKAAVDAKIARLRTLRLAKEAADKDAASRRAVAVARPRTTSVIKRQKPAAVPH